MKKTATLAVVGGDLRQACLARLLLEDGHSVGVYALERQQFPEKIYDVKNPKVQFAKMDAVILPMPVTVDGIYLNAPLSNAPYHMETILDSIPPEKVVLCGAASPQVCAQAESNRLKCMDYLQREELAIRNAVPTAEGALQIAMEELPITLHGARALVLGYGRIGSLLARRLHSLGAMVSVSARSYAAFAHIDAEGMKPLDTRMLTGQLGAFDVLFNTVPAKILGTAELAELREDCLVIDLASKPGGVDFDGAQKLSRRVIWALSLPGKVAPISAAKAIRDTVYHILEEEGIL